MLHSQGYYVILSINMRPLICLGAIFHFGNSEVGFTDRSAPGCLFFGVFFMLDKNEKRFSNKPEDAFRELAGQMGWRVTKRGWPDFFCETEDGEFAAVEVKPKRTHLLKFEQFVVMKVLESFGIKCYRYTPVAALRSP